MSEYLVRPMDEIAPVVPSLKMHKVFRTRKMLLDRRAISTSLPICQNVLPYQPDPDDAPGQLGAVMKRMAFDPRSLDSAGTESPQLKAFDLECPPMENKASTLAEEFKGKFSLHKRRFRLRKLRRFTARFCRQNFVPITPDEDLTVETWLASTDYEAKRKAQLLETNRRWFRRRDGFEKKVTIVKGFVKNEWYDAKKPHRLINARSDVFKTLWGPLSSNISKKVFASKWFIKNVPVKERPFVIRDAMFSSGRWYYCTDYTSFESHFDKDNQDAIEFEVYKFFVSLRPDLQNHLNDICGVLGGMNFIVYANFLISLLAKRCSGEMSTSLGNGISNLILYLFLCYLKGLPEPVGFVEGDDGIFTFTSAVKDPPSTADFTWLQWNIKMITTDRLETASFCGNVFDLDELEVVTDPRWAIATLGWTPKRYVHCSETTRLQLLRARGYSLVYQYGSCPMLGKLGHKILDLTHHIRVPFSRLRSFVDAYRLTGLVEAFRSKIPEPVEPGPGTRRLVAELYGVTLHQQLEFELFVDTLELGCVFTVNYDYPIGWDDQFSRYVIRRGDRFSPPLASLAEQKRVLMKACPEVATEFYDQFED